MSAPNLKEIEWAISELEDQESSEKRYILLAALYTCRNQMLGVAEPANPVPAAHSEKGSGISEVLSQYGDSDFLQTVDGLPAKEAWMVMDELMETLQVVSAKTYDSVLRKLKRIRGC